MFNHAPLTGNLAGIALPKTRAFRPPLSTAKASSFGLTACLGLHGKVVGVARQWQVPVTASSRLAGREIPALLRALPPAPMVDTPLVGEEPPISVDASTAVVSDTAVDVVINDDVSPRDD